MLQAGDQSRVLDPGSCNPVKQIADHRFIDADILNLAGLTRPCATEHMRDIRSRREGRLAGRRILKLDRDMAVRPSQINGTARHGHDGPALHLEGWPA